MTFYCVTSSVNDRGEVHAAITAVCEADKQPESSFVSTSRRDVYSDWFASYEDAKAFMLYRLSV